MRLKDKERKKIMKRILLLLLFYSLLPSFIGQAANCSIATTPVNFGNYDMLSAVPLGSTGTLTVTCSSPDHRPTPVNVKLSAGGSGNAASRSMRPLAGGTDLLLYNLFIDPAGTIIWGDGTGGTATFSGAVSRSNPVSVTVFGKIIPRQNIAAGLYTDAVTAIVEW